MTNLIKVKNIIAILIAVMLFTIAIYANEKDLIDDFDIDSYVKSQMDDRAENYNPNSFKTKGSIELKTNYGITAEHLQKLTDEDFNYIIKEVKKYAKEKSVSLSGEEANLHCANLIKKISANRSSATRELSPNGVESNMINEHPIEGIQYALISTACRDKALEIYTENSCWFDGNGDAFRHVSWSALLYQAFYGLHDNNHDDAEARTLAWTYAHEGYAENQTYPSPYDTSLDLVVQMDLYNNQVGIVFGRVLIRLGITDREDIFERVEGTIDAGNAKRIDVVAGNPDPVLVPTSNTEKN